MNSSRSRGFLWPSAVSLAAAICFLHAPSTCRAINFGQVDTFQDGTVMNWQASVNAPSNIPTGGPSGVGDAFLVYDTSSAAAPMAIFNLAQWTGDYATEGVQRVTANMINLGSTTLQMRLAIRGGPNGTEFVSTLPVALSGGGFWTPVTFDLTSSALTNVSGPDTLDQVLGNVIELRLLSTASVTFAGDVIEGTLAVDNITAIDFGMRLRITAFTKVSNMPQISFTTIAGRTHRVEKKNALSDTSWQPIADGSDVTGNGGVMQVTDTEPGAGSATTRFYRVELLQP